MERYSEVPLVPSSVARQAVAEAQLSGRGSEQPRAQSLPQKASAAEVVIIIGAGDVTYVDLTVGGFEFHRAIAIPMDITSLDGFTGPHRPIATRLDTAWNAIVRTTPKAEPTSDTTACDIRALRNEQRLTKSV